MIDQVYQFQIANSLPMEPVPKRGNAVHQTCTKIQLTKEMKQKDHSDSPGLLTAPSGSKKSRAMVEEDMEDDTHVRQESQSAPGPPVTGGNTGQIPTLFNPSCIACLANIFSRPTQRQIPSTSFTNQFF